MSTFITNFQSPVGIEDLQDRLENGRISNLDMILHYDLYPSIEWTVDKDARTGDTVLFMCAKTSVDHIGHICAELKKAGIENSDLSNFAKEQRNLYKKYAGSIIAVGRVADEPFQDYFPGWKAPYWRSPWYAVIEDICLLQSPVYIAEFRDFIKVSRTGAITKLTDEQWENLSKIIAEKNENSCT